MESLRWIQRVDNLQTSTHCWKVVVKRRSVYMHKYFSDNVYGNKNKALKAAIAYRDELIQHVSGIDYLLWRRDIERPNNTSGIIGVGRYKARPRGSQIEYPYWQAYWRDADGKRHSRTFTIKLYGEDRAREFACEARRKGLMAVEQELEHRLAEQIRSKK